MIYHSATKKDWEHAQNVGYFTSPSLPKDGFIHCSLLEQLVAITNLVYEKRDDIVILEIDETKLNSKVILEDLKQHGRFPHIYGTIDLKSVNRTYPMLTDENPQSKVHFKLPPELIAAPERLN